MTIAMCRSRETAFQEEEDRSAKAERQGTERHCPAWRGGGLHWVGFVSQGKELGFLLSVGFSSRGGICSVLGKH